MVNILTLPVKGATGPDLLPSEKSATLFGETGLGFTGCTGCIEGIDGMVGIVDIPGLIFPVDELAPSDGFEGCSKI